MAKFSVDNDVSSVTSHYNDFVSNDFVGNDFVRADLIVPKNRNWESQFNDVQSDGDEPTPIAVRIFETENNFYLWVNQQNQLFSGAPDIDSSSAQFTITTPDLSDPSYIQIGLVAFNDPKIVAADFSGGSPSLIIVRAGLVPRPPTRLQCLRSGSVSKTHSTRLYQYPIMMMMMMIIIIIFFSPSQTDPATTNVVSLFHLGGTGISESISVIDPSSETTYYWDIDDDWAVVLTLQPSEVFELREI